MPAGSELAEPGRRWAEEQTIIEIYAGKDGYTAVMGVIDQKYSSEEMEHMMADLDGMCARIAEAGSGIRIGELL